MCYRHKFNLWAASELGLMKSLKKTYELAPHEHLGLMGRVSLDLVQIELEIESDMDTLA